MTSSRKPAASARSAASRYTVRSASAWTVHRSNAARQAASVARPTATLAACRAAFDRWTVHADADLTVYLDAALRALAAGFRDDVITGEPRGTPNLHM